MTLQNHPIRPLDHIDPAMSGIVLVRNAVVQLFAQRLRALFAERPYPDHPAWLAAPP